MTGFKAKDLVAVRVLAVAFAFVCACGLLFGCASQEQQDDDASDDVPLEVSDLGADGSAADGSEAAADDADASGDAASSDSTAQPATPTADELRAKLSIAEDYRTSFVHGNKGAEYQKYIVLHDTEGTASAASVVSSWDNAGAGIAAHFVVNKDGSIVQCVPLDKIAHHAGWGDTGHNAQYGVEDSRDDKGGQKKAPSWAKDYGMNSYAVGIELVHVGGSGAYPAAQLEALDGLIAYIDAYYGGNAGQIIDHKAWRSGNSDTSKEFADYLANYQDHRTHT